MPRYFGYIAIAIILVLALSLGQSFAISSPQDKERIILQNHVMKKTSITFDTYNSKHPIGNDTGYQGKSKTYDNRNDSFSAISIDVSQNYGHRQHGAPDLRNYCGNVCKREKHNLKTQESMAEAAWAMFWITSATLVIGVVGAFLLWKDISVAREIGQAQTRAYVDVQGAKYLNTINEKYTYSADLGIKALVTITNTGQTPARNIKLRRNEHTLALTELKDFNLYASHKEFSDPFTLGSGSSFSVTIDNILSADEYESLIQGNSHTYFFGEISYQDVFGKKWKTTYWLRIENFGTDRLRIFPYGNGNRAT